MSLFDGELEKPKQRKSPKKIKNKSRPKGKPTDTRSFQLCYCDQNAGSQDYDPRFGHDYHREELDLFKEECQAWKDAEEK